MTLPSAALPIPDHWLDILFRLCLAIASGAAVGWERQIEHKPAGLRTHMLVSLGAALFVLTSLQLSEGESGADAISRVIQGITAGIGFLGAGEIFSKYSSRSDEVKVRGLTSAAAIWISASLGVAAGCGLWLLCLLGALSTVLILAGVKKIE